MNKQSKGRKEWDEGFLDGITYAVEVLGTNCEEGAAEMLLKESSMGKEILKNSKKKNPEIYKELIRKL